MVESVSRSQSAEEFLELGTTLVHADGKVEMGCVASTDDAGLSVALDFLA